MKIPVIRALVENHTLEQLVAAEIAIAEGLTPVIPVDGEDEGEQLTHAYAAMIIKQDMENGNDFMTALRNYTSRVRQSLN